jgi:hypothetical protein
MARSGVKKGLNHGLLKVHDPVQYLRVTCLGEPCCIIAWLRKLLSPWRARITASGLTKQLPFTAREQI